MANFMTEAGNVQTNPKQLVIPAVKEAIKKL